MNYIKRGIAVMLIAVLGFVFTVQPIYQKESKAAANNKKYISEVKLYISKDGGGTQGLKHWCDSQDENKDNDPDNDWYPIELNINEGSGGLSGKEVGVYLCYRTTTDPKKAIKDMALMNEQGNYSEAEYEKLVNEQKDMYTDMVNDMKEMLEEYRANYNNSVPMAVKAHDFLNAYIEDDSGKSLGDFLLDVTDERLAEALLQMNGSVVLTVQQQIASACDTGKSTWLDRMETLGSYQGLRKQFLKAYNNNTAKADAALKAKYHEKALVLYDSWYDLHQHFESIDKFVTKAGIDKMTEKECEKWIEENFDDGQGFAFAQEYAALVALDGYKYISAGAGEGGSDGETLLSYFYQSRSAFEGSNIKYLYPLAASLSDGQLSAVGETVSLFNILQDALGASLYNDYQKGQGAEILKNATSEEKEGIDQIKDYVDDSIEEWTSGDKISVYEGVDRQVFEGGVAVTSAAEKYSTGADTPWVDGFVDGGGFKKCALGLTISTVISGIISYGFKCAQGMVYIRAIHKAYDTLNRGFQHAANLAKNFNLSYDTVSYIQLNSLDRMVKLARYGGNFEVEGAQQSAINALNELDRVAKTGVPAYKLFRALKIGFAMFTVLLAIADIVMTSITLYKYYNREHMPKPHHMVDLSYNEDKEPSYVAYRCVLDNSGECGDTNGDFCKQWLALYTTTDEDAGDPILVPDGDDHQFQIKKGKDGSNTPSGYSPLHMFGSKDVPQNLTFSDGESGWSYGDKSDGLYMYFQRDEGTSTSDGEIGTSITYGKGAIIGGTGMLVGIFIGVAACAGFRRRKVMSDDKDK
ncbi:MAG: hypothetical protein IJ807_00710 [Eubacterium sp.]|nr:hypothetical protein [Eubacterium sp.]